jgi:hypothetical protein
MFSDYSGQMISCAAILIAAIILNCLPREIRRALFVVLFGVGALSAIASFADIAAVEAVTRLFG